MRPASLAMLALTAAAAHTAAAQDPAPIDTAARVNAIALALARVKPRTPVRVRLVNRSQRAGPVVSSDAGSLVVGPYMGYADADTTIPLAAIDTLWVRGTLAKRGVMYGAAIGLLAGAASGNLDANLCGGARSGCPGDRIVAGVVGGAAGALVGWVIGSSLPHWAVRFPPRVRPPRRPVRF